MKLESLGNRYFDVSYLSYDYQRGCLYIGTGYQKRMDVVDLNDIENIKIVHQYFSQELANGTFDSF